MPVKYQRDLKEAGINIHHPKYAEWWNSTKDWWLFFKPEPD